MSREKSGAHRESTPWRLMRAVDVLVALQLSHIRVSGREHLDAIQPGGTYIIATTHHSDLDVAATIATIGRQVDLAIVDQSVHHSPQTELSMYVGLQLAGQSNFIPVDWRRTANAKVPGTFNPDNYAPMLRALKSGKRVLIAAHNPRTLDTDGGIGHGATYLAALSGATIIPVAVRLSRKDLGVAGTSLSTFFNKPSAHVIIGAPIIPRTIDGIETLGTLIHNKGAPERLAAFTRIKNSLKVESALLDRRLATLSKTQ